MTKTKSAERINTNKSKHNSVKQSVAAIKKPTSHTSNEQNPAHPKIAHPKKASNPKQRKLRQLAKILGYNFKELSLLEEAVTHRSKQGKNNERLEYLGDSILGFVVAEQLYLRFPSAAEGQLSRSRSTLVKGETLAKLAREIDLGEFLLLGPGELKSGGFRRNSTLADAYEAVIGAIYLDGGLDKAKKFINKQFQPVFETINLKDSLKDPKTQLQEWLQSRRKPLPKYTIVETVGTEHDQLFKVECVVDGLENPTVGEGSSRRKAEQAAAKIALQCIEQKP